MRTTLLILFIFYFTGCTKAPEAQVSKEILAKEQIEKNKTEAQVAKDEYLRLQQQRDRH